MRASLVPRSDTSSDDYHSVYFTSRDTGWVGDPARHADHVGRGLKLYPAIYAVPTTVSDVRFLNPAVGYALADKYFLSTTNGGFSWIPRLLDSVNALNALDFPSIGRGWIVADNGEIKQTTDNGATWNRLVNNTTLDLYDNFFHDGQTGWSVGSRGTVLRTVTGGLNWIRDLTPTNNALRSVYFTSPTTGWAVGDAGTVLRTTDGFNWSDASPGVNGSLSSVYFIDVSTGWILGEQVTMLKTTDGGTTWNDSDPADTVYSYVAMHFADNGYGWRLGNYGTLNGLTTISRTTDGGITWDSVAMDARALLSVWFTDRDTGWAVGRFHRIIKTTDGGFTWTSQNNPSRGSLHFLGVTFTDAQRGWIAGGSGTILRTVDGGATRCTRFQDRSRPLWRGLHRQSSRLGRGRQWRYRADGRWRGRPSSGSTATTTGKLPPRSRGPESAQPLCAAARRGDIHPVQPRPDLAGHGADH